MLSVGEREEAGGFRVLEGPRRSSKSLTASSAPSVHVDKSFAPPHMGIYGGVFSCCSLARRQGASSLEPPVTKEILSPDAQKAQNGPTFDLYALSCCFNLL